MGVINNSFFTKGRKEANRYKNYATSQGGNSLGGDLNEFSRVVSELKREGLYDDITWMTGPGFGVSGPNRINALYGGIGGTPQDREDATQGTAADQPVLSRGDDRMNLATHSRFPGTLGAATPTGWGASSFSTSAPDGEIATSDDPSYTHQAWEVPALSGERRVLTQSFDGFEGQELICAARVEANGWASGNVASVILTNASNVETRDGLDVVVAGEWAYRVMSVLTTASTQYSCGVGRTGNATSNSVTRFSRPMVLYKPQSWGEFSQAQKQAYLTDHYAASGTDHQEFPGFRGMRAPHFSEHALNGLPTPTLGTEFTWAAFHTFYSETINRFMRLDGNGVQLYVDSSDRYRLDLQDGSNNQITAALGATASRLLFRAPRLLTGVARVSDPIRLYVDDDEVVTGGNIPSLLAATGGLELGFSGNAGPFSMPWAMTFDRALAPAEIATLNNILRG